MGIHHKGISGTKSWSLFLFFFLYFIQAICYWTKEDVKYRTLVWNTQTTRLTTRLRDYETTCLSIIAKSTSKLGPAKPVPDVTTNRGDHTLNYKECLKNSVKNNRAPMNPAKRLAQEHAICQDLVEDCPAPRDHEKCPPNLFYGNLKGSCRVFEKIGKMNASWTNQHQIVRQIVKLRTTKPCWEEFKRCLELKTRISLSYDVMFGLRNSRFKAAGDSRLSCREWHHYQYKIKLVRCRPWAAAAVPTLPFSLQSRPIPNHPPYQESRCN